jgi:tetratricopeptide (TPR) repeat protein
MKKITLILIIVILPVYSICFAQTKADNSKIDIMLIHGDYNKVIDTCRQILAYDSLNAEINFKMGLAYQNLLSDDKSFDCFLKAATLSPDNNNYNFMVAKSYFNKGKSILAKPLLLKLCDIDSMNWTYVYYLTSILMQEGKYDESIKIYNRFYIQDSTNYVFMDKIGFASLKKGDFGKAIDLFNRSLALNKKNINAIKNLSYLYTATYRTDTAIQLLTKGIKIDPTDMDLYVRRATINYSKNYTKRALDDYLKILSSGDSSVLYLKRAGIGYANNLQPKKAVEYLLIAYEKDSSDYEVSSYLARNYERLNDLKSSAYYYRHITRILNPFVNQLGLNYILLAEVLKSDSLYNEAITAYLKSQEFRSDVNIYMIIANLYDEKLHDIPKAIYYYQLFLDNLKNSKMNFKPDYFETIKKRLEFLKNPKPTNK